MTFQEIYNQTIKYFPSEIDISDGKVVENRSGKFQHLLESWENAELKTENESDLLKLMIWGIYCAYHKKAIENFQNGKMTVSVTELDMKYLKYKFEESLLDTELDYYSELRTHYLKE